MHFVFWFSDGDLASQVQLWLSAWMFFWLWLLWTTRIFCASLLFQVDSLILEHKLMYSASVQERATTYCCRAAKDKVAPLIITEQPLADFPVAILPAQFASRYAGRKFFSPGPSYPKLKYSVFKMYNNACCMAIILAAFGLLTNFASLSIG